MGSIESFVDQNLDELYQNKDDILNIFTQANQKRSLSVIRRKASLRPTAPGAGGISELRYHKSHSVCYRRNYRLKMKFRDDLLDLVHTLLDKKRHSSKCKFYHNVKDHCKPQVLYQQKN